MINAAKLDDAVYKTTLKSALAGDETMQAKLFDMWVKAPKKERQAEINKIVFSREGVDGNKAFLKRGTNSRELVVWGTQSATRARSSADAVYVCRPCCRFPISG